MLKLTLTGAAVVSMLAAAGMAERADAGGDVDALTECGLIGAGIGLLYPPAGAGFIFGCVIGYEIDQASDSSDGSFPTFDMKASVDAAEFGVPCIPGCICVTEPCPCCPLIPWLVLDSGDAVPVKAGVFSPALGGWKPGVVAAKLSVIDIRDIASMPVGAPIEMWSWHEAIQCQPSSTDPGSFVGVFDPSDHAGLSSSYLLRMELKLASGATETAYVAAGMHCAGDVDFDGDVDSNDLNVVLAGFGGFAAPTAGFGGDADFDGQVDSADLNMVLANFGKVCGVPGAA